MTGHFPAESSSSGRSFTPLSSSIEYKRVRLVKFCTYSTIHATQQQYKKVISIPKPSEPSASASTSTPTNPTPHNNQHVSLHEKRRQNPLPRRPNPRNPKTKLQPIHPRRRKMHRSHHPRLPPNLQHNTNLNLNNHVPPPPPPNPSPKPPLVLLPLLLPQPLRHSARAQRRPCESRLGHGVQGMEGGCWECACG